MKKRWIVILIAVSMLMFGSLAFAGDGVQDKATSESNLTGAVMLANNSQVSFQVDDGALEKFRVEQEMGREDMFMAYVDCPVWCQLYVGLCCPASPSGPGGGICSQIVIDCGCSCSGGP